MVGSGRHIVHSLLNTAVGQKLEDMKHTSTRRHVDLNSRTHSQASREAASPKNPNCPWPQKDENTVELCRVQKSSSRWFLLGFVCFSAHLSQAKAAWFKQPRRCRATRCQGPGRRHRRRSSKGHVSGWVFLVETMCRK